MALITLQATVNQTPDPNFGTDSTVTTPSNTGYATSQVQDLGVGAQQNKSCRWSGYSNVTARKTKVTVKFDWQIVNGGGSTDISLGGTANADASFNVQLSTDGGSTFASTMLTRSGNISGNNTFDLTDSGSVSFDVSPIPSDLSQIQIRSRMHANATTTGNGSAQATVNANVSNIKVEVITNTAAIIVAN